jgi:hypothetical protein
MIRPLQLGAKGQHTEVQFEEVKYARLPGNPMCQKRGFGRFYTYYFHTINTVHKFEEYVAESFNFSPSARLDNPKMATGNPPTLH